VSGEPLRVVLADDNYLVREGTRQLLEVSGEIEVLAAVGDPLQLVEAVRALRPQAVLTDIRMPPTFHMEGIEAAHALRAEHPDLGVVVLSQHADDSYALELFRDGTAGLGYLLKERVSERGELVHALHEAAAGRAVIDPAIVEALVLRRSRAAASPLFRLSDRERDVLREMARGSTNPAIARTLALSTSSVEKLIGTIFSKLGLAEEPQVHRRVTAVLAWLQDEPGRSRDAGR
jgi:DNA-binding NarL/FixJ family response regulator